MGDFSVKSAYVCLADFDSSMGDGVFKLLWQVKPYLMCYLLPGGVYGTNCQQDLIFVRRGVQVSSLNCVLCQASEESTQHLFVECTLTQLVWSQCFKWIGILFIQHKDLKRHFESFHLSFDYQAESGLERHMGDNYKVYMGAKKFNHV